MTTPKTPAGQSATFTPDITAVKTLSGFTKRQPPELPDCTGTYVVEATGIDHHALRKLIAAAPDLLEACKLFMDHWDTWFKGEYTDTPLGEVAKEIQAAIARATQ